MRVTRFLAVLGMVPPLATLQSQQPRLESPRDTVLMDERIRITVSGLRPSSLVTVRLTSMGPARVTSHATFIADHAGRVDLGSAMPVFGSYATIDGMGLFWSAAPEGPARPPVAARMTASAPRPMGAVLIAEVDGHVVATDTVWRRAIAPDVRITRLRDSVLGVLYEPPGTERRPAMIVLSGSQGGTPPGAGLPGGFASRGYVVLALPYFNDEGVPEHLSNIPLEYFERALVWLRARPNVDPARVGVVGGSRGGELALLLGATYPQLVRFVVANAPSHVVWPSCCAASVRANPAWTLKGQPVPHMPPSGLAASINETADAPMRMTAVFLHRLGDTAAARRATIPVERIAGPVLLASGKDDRLWPSHFMAEQVVQRLRRHGFAHPVRHLTYEDAGHNLGRPYTSTMNLNDNTQPVSGQRNDAGGSPAAQARARETYWREMFAFLEEHVMQKPRP